MERDVRMIGMVQNTESAIDKKAREGDDGGTAHSNKQHSQRQKKATRKGEVERKHKR